MRRRIAPAAVCLAAALTFAACANHASVGTTTSSSSTTTSGPGSAPPTGLGPRTDAAGTVWLCRPGLQAGTDPCLYNPTSTAVSASGAKTVTTASAGGAKPVDCFYVYPTVSTQPRDNANLRIQKKELVAAVVQASRFSSVCNVWAPMYRQRTVSSLALGLGADKPAAAIAYASLVRGWDDYLAHYNDGRPIVFIGHSQGAAILIQLLRSQVDNSAALRGRLIGAIILGGNVDVPVGKLVGGSFQHIPACSSNHEYGCVIAYSSFPSEPPATSLFGRPGQGVSLQWGETARAGLQVVCVNPAALSGGAADLDPYFLTATSPTPGVDTGWVEYPGRYRAKCESAGGATWLNVLPASPSDVRPAISETLGPDWGFHVEDVNLALGNLVRDVAQMELAYSAAH
ncbi:MAG: DUF3089 domain-containing protein [Acidimicrobiales bacterium]